MALVRFDPFRELEEMSARLSSLASRPKGGQAEIDSFGDWAPAMDVQETDAEYIVKADVPDVPRDQIAVHIEDGVLCIEGERRQEQDPTTRHYHRLERAYGKFVRRLTVPTDVDEARVSASFKDGVLSVRLPKSPGTRPRSVRVPIG